MTDNSYVPYVNANNPTPPWPSSVTRVWIRTPEGGATVYLGNGRVLNRGTAPVLKRLVGLSEDALKAYAKRCGWNLTLSGDDKGDKQWKKR